MRQVALFRRVFGPIMLRVGIFAVLEVPGPDGHGPDATQVAATKKLHARWAAKVKS